MRLNALIRGAVTVMLALFLSGCLAHVSHEEKLKGMFKHMEEEKNISLLPVYYDRNFELYSNGKKMDYDQFFNP